MNEGERIDELANWVLFFFVAEGQRQDLRHWVLLFLLSFVAVTREKGFDALGDVVFCCGRNARDRI